MPHPQTYEKPFTSETDVDLRRPTFTTLAIGKLRLIRVRNAEGTQIVLECRWESGNTACAGRCQLQQNDARKGPVRNRPQSRKQFPLCALVSVIAPPVASAWKQTVWREGENRHDDALWHAAPLRPERHRPLLARHKKKTLKFGEDGSLTIYVQKESPGKDKKAEETSGGRRMPGRCAKSMRISNSRTGVRSP